jgi:hypothetical protein
MKKFFRIVLKGHSNPNLYFDLEVPNEASLPQFMSNVAMAGAIVQEKFYVPYDQIAHVSVVTMEQSVQGFTPRVVN